MEWTPVEMETVIGDYYCRVSKDKYGPPRWRWAVTRLELIQRCRSKPVERAEARGYAKSFDRAKTMAEMAAKALKNSTAAGSDELLSALLGPVRSPVFAAARAKRPTRAAR